MGKALARLCLGLCLISHAIAAEAAESRGAPAVVASIAPVHSLAAMVMDGVAAPRLLLPGGTSPHAYALKPSDARDLTRAALVIWVGPELERFLVKPLASLGGGARKLELAKIPGLTLRSARRGGLWEEPDAHQHAAVPEQHGHGAGGLRDPHIWLDPGNAIVMIGAIARTLARLDAANGPRYASNMQRAAAKISALDSALVARLAPVRRVPYFVFHDAYGYFEARYGLNALGAIVVASDRRPGIKRLKAIRARLSSARAACVFTEPQFAPAIAATVTEGTGAAVGVLDPLGVGLAPGPGLYPALLNGLARGLLDCLARPRRGQ